MSPSFVSKFRTNNLSFYVGTDNYHPEWTKELIATGGQVSNPSLPHPLSIIGGMLVDFWLFSASDVFLGNPLSTLSWNVCAIRRVAGKECANLPRPDLDACFMYPDECS
eukprot:NODE_2426_length_927_cov_52.148064_g1996_i0.p1 GENE.NODE_2426_length_927_cov_52.148064_g1996_i0~~NODE_2426_length_927_cov_52.148064_g1996_i0.p1  ORF type:complete len:109 (+),score=21.25 NODE_2426_length_927_cov_52.148064_g1996_i0:530-856(+)